MAVPGLVLGWLWPGTAVLADEMREVRGLMGRLLLVDGPATPAPSYSSSFLGRGVTASLRTESAEGARPVPELIRLMGSEVAGGSAPGTGEGALEPLVAAALSICALS